jgi:hypothetical protein
VRTPIFKKHVAGVVVFPTTLDTGNLRVAVSGYVGIRGTKKEKNAGLRGKTTYSLEDLLGKNSAFDFDLKMWDGR